MQIEEGVSLQGKTTMRMGGKARFYADLHVKEDVGAAVEFAAEQNLPLIVLGGGSNTVFADGEINALVVRITTNSCHIERRPDMTKTTVKVEAGKTLAVLLNDLAEEDLDLSALTGIPGTVGGAVFGNAGQGAGGVWIDSFVEEVDVYVDREWKILTKDQCDFRYRESGFKDKANASSIPPIIWNVTLSVPDRPKEEVQAEIERLLQKRIETQPHIKTAGSCFKSLPDGTPAWKLIDAAGLRGLKIGGVEVSEKHANFLLNTAEGNMGDLLDLTKEIQKSVPEIAGIEMRLFGEDGKLAY